MVSFCLWQIVLAEGICCLCLGQRLRCIDRERADKRCERSLKESANILSCYIIVAICFSTAALINAFMDMPACLASEAIRLCVSGEMRMFSDPE